MFAVIYGEYNKAEYKYIVNLSMLLDFRFFLETGALVLLEPPTHWSFLVDRLNDKFLIVEGDVSYLAPWETNLGCQPGTINDNS